ncbi:hypothetical protein [Flavobacterium wongokense]|uniref:hypothetical protein n=1 Tax=Flavobacterium wongokense TaxID=2910674 RepID=UPI001F403EC5|nr:hypothetical protein [Flavobacterium sp. WG47]MCF6133544.1 hypothetical protein [Flavobacterium sp. WG47]
MKKTTVIFGILFGVLSCTSKKVVVEETEKNSQNRNKVEIIKFMGTITTFSTDIGEDTFWNFPDEHAKLTINDDGFIEDIKSLKSKDESHFLEYTYAFIVHKKNETDTLYSDSTLKTWILKKSNGKKEYFYDEEGITAENLRHSYSFFKDCW